MEKGTKRPLSLTVIMDFKGFPSLLKTRKTMVFAYGFMATFVLCTGFLAVNPSVNTSFWFSHFSFGTNGSLPSSPSSSYSFHFSSMFSYIFPETSPSFSVNEKRESYSSSSHNQTVSKLDDHGRISVPFGNGSASPPTAKDGPVSGVKTGQIGGETPYSPQGGNVARNVSSPARKRPEPRTVRVNPAKDGGLSQNKSVQIDSKGSGAPKQGNELLNVSSASLDGRNPVGKREDSYSAAMNPVENVELSGNKSSHYGKKPSDSPKPSNGLRNVSVASAGGNSPASKPAASGAVIVNQPKEAVVLHGNLSEIVNGGVVLHGNFSSVRKTNASFEKSVVSDTKNKVPPSPAVTPVKDGRVSGNGTSFVKTIPMVKEGPGNSPSNLAGKLVVNGKSLSLTNTTVSASGSYREKVESSAKCDIFDGRWVRNDSYPLYPPGSCPYIDEPFDCYLNGRPERGYEKWRWQPKGCNIPRLDPKDMLERLRGKRLVFIGDSLNRNMWESLVCVLRHAVKNKKKVFEASGRHEFRTEGSYSFRYMDYNCSVEFFRSPFLVQEWETPEPNGTTKETLRLDIIENHSSKYKDADILVFNTGHWWTHEKTSKGRDYYQEGNHVYGELDVQEAFKKALKTWAKWVDANVNPKKTTVFFRGYSSSHFSGGQWNSGGQCDNETEPIKQEAFLSQYPPKMRVLESVLSGMKTPISYLNITRMTDYRKDAHPSIYRKQDLSEEERRAPERFQDCSHWCLPGLPETWNELLYAKLVMMRK